MIHFFWDYRGSMYSAVSLVEHMGKFRKTLYLFLSFIYFFYFRFILFRGEVPGGFFIFFHFLTILDIFFERFFINIGLNGEREI